MKYLENYIAIAVFEAIQCGYNMGRDLAGRNLVNAEMVTYTAIMDKRTCNICRSLDGMQIDLRDNEGQLLYEKYSPPQHVSCRCIFLYHGAGDSKIPIEIGILNKNFDKEFTNKYNKINESNLSIEEIVAKGMQRNIQSSEFIYNSDVWDEYRDGINEVIKDVKKKKNDNSLLSLGLIAYVLSQLGEEEEAKEEEEDMEGDGESDKN
jgi:hypothetical protein